jgi:DNA-binding NarL/FixJ family response regulator
MLGIWLIEDNVAFRRLTEIALKSREDITLRCFRCCEDALAAMAAIGEGQNIADSGKPSVILLDVGLPGMDGIDGIQKFKAILPETPILILTVFEEDEKIFRAICAGASGYLLKSEPLENVIAAVDQAIAGGAPMTPFVAARVLGMFSKFAPAKKDYGLSAREQQVLEWMAEGLSKKQIADKLQLSTFTVINYMRSVYRKLHVNCQTAAVSVALRGGLLK